MPDLWRGVIYGLALSLPLWGLVVFIVWRLVA